MGVLQRFERRLEGLVEGAFARAFKGRVEPVEIANALDREAADKAAIVSAGRTLVPNDYVVELGTTDYARIGPYAGPLGAELAQMLRESAQENQWSFIGPVTVAFEEVADLDTGVFRVRSGVSSGEKPSGGLRQTAGPEQSVEPRVEAARQDPGAFTGNPRLVISSNGQAITGSIEARGGERAYALTKPVTVIGRGNDADLRLLDPGVSRQHVRVEVIDGEVFITDLGSTNGTTINGAALTGPALLTTGQRITLGTTNLVFVQDEAGSAG
ncbi:MAG: FhaA domain-containing protein [Frankiaceae bacterium]